MASCAMINAVLCASTNSMTLGLGLEKWGLAGGGIVLTKVTAFVDKANLAHICSLCLRPFSFARINLYVFYDSISLNNASSTRTAMAEACLYTSRSLY
ncbi:hypothetical protein BC939DRAFT_471036 [Gamsiella multidivaricata]|uniref:uncharacterized protein n=1 Tax=Gamsiella multidivaricata TaxID=101098 RepID=UPI00221F7305|nr:uncharacterized protein BC939DRAFT_471036 [Gamsiella multidivaricata]KAI7815908.1 hypothetical protein BC939DRAFT_471036 [Gamsiella multidivaricata]